MLDANGYLAALTNPELETTGFSYTDDGLMLAKTDARQNSSSVTYDALGLLDKDRDCQFFMIRFLRNTSAEILQLIATGGGQFSPADYSLTNK